MLLLSFISLYTNCISCKTLCHALKRNLDTTRLDVQMLTLIARKYDRRFGVSVSERKRRSEFSPSGVELFNGLQKTSSPIQKTSSPMLERFPWPLIMMASSTGNIFRVTGSLSGATGEFPTQRLVTRTFDVFFDLRLNKQSNVKLVIWDAIALIMTLL